MKRILIATLIGLAAFTAGCTGTTGNANPTPTEGGTTSTTNSEAASGLEAVKACDLLTDAEAISLGMDVPGKAEKVASSDGCGWLKSGDGRIRAGIRTESGVKDLNLQGDRVSEIKVGKFDATKVEAPDGAKSQCTIVISVTDKSSVSVISTLNLSNENTAASCERASKAANLIAPKLP